MAFSINEVVCIAYQSCSWFVLYTYMLLGGFNISCFGNALNLIEISAEEWA